MEAISWRQIDEVAARRLNRRQALGALGALGVVSCGGGGSDGTSSTSTGSTGMPSTPASCVLIPEETVGPYPLWNDIASAAVFQRQDITEGRAGVPLNLALTIVNVSNSCAPITDAMVYVWHCDKDGAYSGYGSQAGQTFCRGVQSTDSNGVASFVTVYPGWYTGRITHIHFRVYLANALAATSQIAFPPEVTAEVYRSSLYSARGQSSISSFSGDGIFADGVQYQLATATANASTGGYDSALTVGIAA